MNEVQADLKKSYVVKTHRLNEAAIHALSFSELRLINLAVVDARDTGKGLSTTVPLRIDALRFAEVFEISKNNAYERLKECEKTLFSRQFTFRDVDGKKVKSNWVQQVKYHDNEGAIEIVFTLAVVEGISKIDPNKDPFTKYLLSQLAHFTSLYSARLYEILIQWKTAGKMPRITVEELKQRLGVQDHEYQEMNDFKKRVLNKALKEINESSDIKVELSQDKYKQKITHFSFTIQTNNASQTTTNDSFFIMSDKQLDVFSSKLADLGEVQTLANVGEEMPTFKARLRSMLKDPEKQKTLVKYLKMVGFKMK